MIDMNNLYNDLPSAKLILANPQKQYIETITCAKEIKGKLNFSTLSEISFKIYEYSDGIRNEMFDLIEEMRLVELVGVAWFQVQSASETQDKDNSTVYKQVKCLTLENELIGKQIDNIIGVYALYDVTDIEYSLLHIVERYCNWSIGHVSNELKSKWRTFNIDSEKIYNLLTGKVAESFGCVFQFDTYAKTINVYTLEELGEVTDITISNRNILQSYERTADKDNIITKMRVRGGTNSDGTIFDIRAVNPDGTTELINIDYYKVPFDPVTKQGWMTQGLVDAINNYQSAYNTYATQYTNTLNTLKQYQSDLTNLKAQLRDIEGQIEVQNIIIGTSVENHNGRPPISGETDYSTYQTAITTRNTLLSQKVAKQTEIRNKSTQISNTQGLLNDISFDLDKNNYFTQSQLNELDSFLTQGDDYTDDTFVSTDITTPEEEIEIKLELRDNAQKDLERCSRPQYNIKTTISNLYTIQDNKDNKTSLSEWKGYLQLGNMITLMFRNDFYVTVRLLSIEFDLDNLSDIELTFSNRNRLDDSLIQLGEVIAQTNRTSKSFSLSQFGYDQASKQTSTVREFMNSSLDATLNKMKSSDKEEVVFDQFGLHMKRWNEGTNTYSGFQSWWNANTLMFSTDGFKTARMAIGQVVLGGNTYYGFVGEAIVGQIILGEQLTITNSSGNYTINNSGLTASATVGVNTYSVGINPSTPADIINVKVNDVKKFYIDTTTNELMFNGKLTANAINADMINALNIVASSVKSNWVYAGNISANQISGGTINGITFISQSLYNYSTTKIEGGILTTNTLVCDGGTSGEFSVTGNYLQMWHPSLGETFSVDGMGNLACKKLNNGTPITSNNLQSQFSSLGITVSNASYATIAGFASEAGTASSADNLKNTVYVSSNSNFRPYGTNTSCGTADGLFTSVWASSGTIQTSDRRLKNSIEDLDERYIRLFDTLKAKRFKMNQGTSNRYHLGFISQDIEDALILSGLDTTEFAGFVKDPVYEKFLEDGEYDTSSDIVDNKYFLRYEEFIALLVLKIKELDNKVKILQEKG